MVLSGECVLVRDGDGWTAEFPQYNFASTSGRTREEALRRAREVLELEAADLLDDGLRAPRARHVAEVVLVTVDVTSEDSERMKYVTKAQAADRLEVSRPRVTALVRSGQLDTRDFGGHELVSIESMNRYLESPRMPGRPSKRELASAWRLLDDSASKELGNDNPPSLRLRS